MTSTQGSNGTWTTYNTPANGTLRSITHNKELNIFIAVGDLGTIMKTADDDLNAWTLSTVTSSMGAAAEDNILDVSYGNAHGMDMMLAVAEGGKIFMEQGGSGNWGRIICNFKQCCWNFFCQ